MSLRLSSTGASPSIIIEPTNNVKAISDIDTWMTAFHTFAAIYLKRFPEQMDNIMKYGETIRRLAKRFGNTAWLYYDTNFRRQRMSSRTPWVVIHPEFYLITCTAHLGGATAGDPSLAEFKGATADKNQGQHPSAPLGDSSPFRFGMCHRYNSIPGCTIPQCRWLHKCKNCSEQHPCTACPKLPHPPYTFKP